MSEIALTGLPVEFNAALTEGRLMIQHCNNCGRPNMYPRYRCPFCQSNDLKYVEAEGTGTLLTYTVVRAVPPAGFEDDLPYALGAVRLTEGVQLLARLEPQDDGDWGGYACDAEVTFAPHPGDATEARPVAWFKPADGDGS